MISPNGKHILVIGGIRESHDQLLRAECKITWFVQKDSMMANDQNRSYLQMLVFAADTAVDMLIGIARAIHEITPFDGICAFHDAQQITALAIAKVLDLRFDYQLQTLENTRNKYAMRKVLSQAGLCSVSASIVDNDDQVVAFLATNPEPQRFIAKPIDGTGSLGVSSLSRQQLNDIAANRLRYPCLLEVFVTGKEYSIEAFSEQDRHHVIAITEKFKDERTFIESGHLVPARLAPEMAVKITKYVQDCLTALGISCGPTHSEIIVNSDEIFFIETHTRVGGDQIPLLVEMATGINLYQLSAWQVLDIAFEADCFTQVDTTRYASIQFMLQSAKDQPISVVRGIALATQMAEVEQVNVRYKVGDLLPPVKHSFDRAASVIAVSETGDKAINAATSALDNITFSHQASSQS